MWSSCVGTWAGRPPHVRGFIIWKPRCTIFFAVFSVGAAVPEVLDFALWRQRLRQALPPILTADEAAFIADELREIEEAEERFLDQLVAGGDDETIPA